MELIGTILLTVVLVPQLAGNFDMASMEGSVFQGVGQGESHGDFATVDSWGTLLVQHVRR